jgi:hypothetical protein
MRDEYSPTLTTRLVVVPRLGGLADLTPLGRHLRRGPDLHRDMAGHDGAAVWDKAGARKEDGAGERGEGAQDVWGGLRRGWCWCCG